MLIGRNPQGTALTNLQFANPCYYQRFYTYTTTTTSIATVITTFIYSIFLYPHYHMLSLNAEENKRLFLSYYCCACVYYVNSFSNSLSSCKILLLNVDTDTCMSHNTRNSQILGSTILKSDKEKVKNTWHI